ncbi:2-oxoacid dehydrogenases acyltransferase-domain-containing protein [Amylostereum chailletii]|nr:2-oxoacid dehydrogenases acyltransferase-domain-containing protein [Amylostereum chailletii]
MLFLRARPLPLRQQFLSSFLHTSQPWWAQRKVLHKFKLADIGEGITECEVIKWSVSPQGSIGQFDPLCEVQSDKASVEITSPYDGTIKELLVKEGEVAKVGEPLCIIEVDEEIATEVGETVSESATPPPHVQQEATQSPAHPGPHKETVSSLPPVESRRRHPLDPNHTSAAATNAADVLALPAVRHFARQSGVDLTLLTPGSGKNGRIERVDVQQYLSSGKDAQSTATGAATPAPSEEDVVVELGRTRYGMWKAMTKSLEIPHFGYSTTLDLTALDAMLPILNAHIPPHYRPPPTSPPPPAAVSPSTLYPPPSPPEVPASGHYTKLTYLPILLKTLSKSMLEWPLLRASITPTPPPSGKPTLTIRPHADISIALSTPSGLYTPTLRAADTHSVYALASQLKHLAHLGRQVPCGLTPAELPKRGGTLTVSNVGAIGAGTSAAPVLVPGGGVAIVALGRVRWEWDVECGDGRGERRLKIGVSWSADHRVVEGAELAAFVETWRGYVERPERLIAEGV